MDVVSMLRERAKNVKGTVVLPESGDVRTLEAAAILVRESIANVVLIGDRASLVTNAERVGLDLNLVSLIIPEEHQDFLAYVNKLYEKRKAKGMTLEVATETMKKPLFFGAALVDSKTVQGMVAGAANTTADVLKAALQVVGVKPGLKTVSSCFIMAIPDFLGEDRIFLFGDCAVVPNPTPEQLADIAISTAETRSSLFGDSPKVAMLSFSTKGSAEHELVDKVRESCRIMSERNVDFAFDGELQADAAIMPQVASSKAPNSQVAGKANVLIFPDLQAGNIGYKLVQRFAKAEAIGPVIQGLAAPICDLSRGCSSEDIVNTTCLVMLMSQV